MASQQGQPNFNINLADDQQKNQNKQPTNNFYKPQMPITNPQINFVNEPSYYNFDNENHNHNTQDNQNKPDYLFLNGNQFVNTDDTNINTQDNSNNNFGSSINLNPSKPVAISPTQELEDPFIFNTRVTRKPFTRETTTTTTTTTTTAQPTTTTAQPTTTTTHPTTTFTPPTTTFTSTTTAIPTTKLPDDTPDRFLE